MKLLTEALKNELPALYSQEKNNDPTVVCRFFHPYGCAEWLVLEGGPVDEEGIRIASGASAGPPADFMFFAYCSLFGAPDAELGYVYLSELESLTGLLAIERDLHFKPCPLSEATERLEARQAAA